MALKSTPKDVAKFRGDWITWFEYMCDTTFGNADEFYDCVYTKMYHRDEMILNNAIFDFATTPKWLILELFVSLVKFLPRL